MGVMQTPTHMWTRHRPYLVTSVAASGATITVPNVVNKGDFGILFDMGYRGAGAPDYVLPAGWTEQNTLSNGTTTRAILSTKLLEDSDKDAVLTGMSASIALKTLLVFGASAYGDLASPWPRAVSNAVLNHTFGLEQHSGEIIGDLPNTPAAAGVLVASAINNPGGLDFTSFGVEGIGQVDAGSVLINNNYQMTRYLILARVRKPTFIRYTPTALGTLQAFALYLSP